MRAVRAQKIGRLAEHISETTTTARPAKSIKRRLKKLYNRGQLPLSEVQ